MVEDERRPKRQIVPIGDEIDWSYPNKKGGSKRPAPPPLPSKKEIIERIERERIERERDERERIERERVEKEKIAEDKRLSADEYRRLTSSLHLIDVDYRNQIFDLIGKAKGLMILINSHSVEINQLTSQSVTIFFLHYKDFEKIERAYVEQNSNKLDRLESEITSKLIPLLEKKLKK